MNAIRKYVSALALFLFAVLLVTTFVWGLASVSTVNPGTGANLSGTVIFNATADNDSQNMTWQFYQGDTMQRNFTNVTGTNISETNQTLYRLSFDTTTITQGIYNVTANASNSSGNSAVTTNIT